MKDWMRNIIKNFPGNNKEQLIPLLQEVQDHWGYLPEELIVMIGKHLNIPTSKIFGLATFYDQFKFINKGNYHIQICMGTACYITERLSILEIIEKELNIKAGQTTKDGIFSIEVVECLGACHLSPVIMINEKYYSSLTTESIPEIINSIRENG